MISDVALVCIIAAAFVVALTLIALVGYLAESPRPRYRRRGLK